jgi:hypothetical protein
MADDLRNFKSTAKHTALKGLKGYLKAGELSQKR